MIFEEFVYLKLLKIELGILMVIGVVEISVTKNWKIFVLMVGGMELLLMIMIKMEFVN
jgi:hypothetical protein